MSTGQQAFYAIVIWALAVIAFASLLPDKPEPYSATTEAIEP